MGDLLSGHQLTDFLYKLVNSAHNNIYLASAFCKQSQIQSLAERVAPLNISKKLLVRYRPSDLILGASDLVDVNYFEDLGWEIYIHQQLHAKTYIVDDCAIIGSANLTRMGLPINSRLGNKELAIFTSDVTLVSAVKQWFDEIVSNAVRLDPDLYNFLHAQISLESKERMVNQQSLKLIDKQFQSLLDKNAVLNNCFRLYTSEFLWTTYQEFWRNSTSLDQTKDFVHDLELLNLNIPFDEEMTKTAFCQSRTYLWLLNILNDELYFGEITERLHEILADDPRPFRKDVKLLVQNLVSWLESCSNDVVIDQPNISTRIRKREI